MYWTNPEGVLECSVFDPDKTLDSGYVFHTFRNDEKFDANYKFLNKWSTFRNAYLTQQGDKIPCHFSDYLVCAKQFTDNMNARPPFALEYV